MLLAVPAYAQRTPGVNNFGRTCPGGGAVCFRVPLTPTRVFNFMVDGTLPNGFTFSRASTANYFDSGGLLVSAAINTPRWDYGYPESSTLQGLFIEPGATNKLLWNRDLTNPVWVQVTATVAKDQTGIDGVSNSASSFLALGANSTICQTITQAASNGTFSAYLKRLSGTGNIAISQDGGATYATVTLTSSWKRFQHANQSTLNPGMCIRIATSADQIAVDYAQYENYTNTGLSFVTSPILTTSAPASRSADNLSQPINSPTGQTDATNRWFNIKSGAFVAEWELPYNNFDTQDGNSGFGLVGALVSGARTIGVPALGQNCPSSTLSFPANTVFKTGATYGRTYFRQSCNGSSSFLSIANPASITAFNTQWLWYLRKFTYWNYPLKTAQLVALTL